MPATTRRTRAQIRQSIGEQTGLIWGDAGAVTSSPSEQSASPAEIIDTNLAFGSEDEHRGKWVYATSSSGTVEIRRAASFNEDARMLTVSNQFSFTPDTGTTYELWGAQLSPARIHSFANDAITEVARKASVIVEADSFHTGGENQSYALDSSWTGVRQVAWRESYTGLSLANMDTAPDSATSTTTVALDSADFREGSGAARLTVAAGESSATAIANSSFTAVDIRGYDQLEFWFKTSSAVTASNYVIQIMQGSSAQVEVSVPASSGDLWTYHTGSISSPENNSSVTAVQVSTGSSDGGAGTLWVDDVKVTRANSGVFKVVPREFWSLSHPNREVRLDGWTGQPYAMLRITGVRAPNLLSSDSVICEIDPNYVISYVHGMALISIGETEAGGALVNRSEALRLRMTMPGNIRWMSD